MGFFKFLFTCFIKPKKETKEYRHIDDLCLHIPFEYIQNPPPDLYKLTSSASSQPKPKSPIAPTKVDNSYSVVEIPRFTGQKVTKKLINEESAPADHIPVSAAKINKYSVVENPPFSGTQTNKGNSNGALASRDVKKNRSVVTRVYSVKVTNSPSDRRDLGLLTVDGASTVKGTDASANHFEKSLHKKVTFQDENAVVIPCVYHISNQISADFNLDQENGGL